MSNRIYLDHVAATPVRPEVKKVMAEVEEKYWANASSLHAEGRAARGVIDDSRAKIATFLGCDTSNIVFTSGATEANVFALRGVLEYKRLKGEKPHLVVSSIEHAGLEESVEQLEKMGLEVTRVKVDHNGIINQEHLANSIKDNTALVSIIYANNETGVMQDISALVKVVKSKNPKTLFHTDASQAVGWQQFKVNDLGVDLLTASSYKLGGPKGLGLLYFRDYVKLQPLFPGIQEWGLRAGSEPTAAIAGMARAWELTAGWPVEKVRGLRNDLIKKMTTNISDILCNTPIEQSVPHIAHFSIADIDSETLNIALDHEAIASSPGSACTSGAVQISHVVQALGVDSEKYIGTLRLSLSTLTTEAEINQAIKIITQTISRLRQN